MSFFKQASAVLIVGMLVAGAMGADAPGPAAPDGGKGYHVEKTLSIGGEGGWDYVIIDPATKLLFVPRATHTQVLRADSGELVADIKDTAGVHGVALAPEVQQGFTSNGKAGTILCFSLKDFKPVATLPAGKKPDAIIYDPASKLVLAFNGVSEDVTPVKTSGDGPAIVMPALALGGKPEYAAADGNGRVYVNLEDKNSIAVIDTKAWKVVETWKIDGGDSPSGLAMDPAGGRLFTGCHNQVMAIIDTKTGKTLQTVPIGKGIDACAFDPGTGEAFASCGDGTLTVVKETSPGKFEVTQTVKTRAGARTMALDPTTHTIYLPTADFDSAATPDGRPTPKPGSFMILVVTPQAK